MPAAQLKASSQGGNPIDLNNRRREALRPARNPSRMGAPSLITFSVLFIAHSVAAINAPIQDCDEVFNFWEPTHYLNHGYGLQTWELSPVYAIRSWLYISLHGIVTGILALALSLFGVDNKVYEFYGLRIVLAALAAGSETRLFNKTARCINPRVAVFFLLVLATSTGNFIASASYLPSSFGMYTMTLALADFIDWRTGLRTASGLMWLAGGTIIGWPFIAILCLPFVLEDVTTGVLTGGLFDSVLRLIDGLGRSLFILAFEVAVDSAFFRKLSIVPLNIVLYNVLAGPGKGPSIYGTEPWYFYVLNLMLNFNIWFILGIAAGPLLFVYHLVRGQGPTRLGWVRSLVITSPLYLWLGVMTLQPHKEERFIYPVYTCIALNAAISLHILALILGSSDHKQLVGRIPPIIRGSVLGAVVLGAILLGLWRSAGLATAYSAPLSIYQHLAHPKAVTLFESEPQKPLNVCVGKEWYRFPSSYHLPAEPRPHRLKFITSHFHGLLPGEFMEQEDVGLFPATYVKPPGMNDENREDRGKYTSLGHCHFVVDFSAVNSSDSEAEPDFVRKATLPSNEFEIVACNRFLDTSRSGIIGRMGWVPDVLSDWQDVPGALKRTWGWYCLLARTSAPVLHGQSAE